MTGNCPKIGNIYNRNVPRIVPYYLETLHGKYIQPFKFDF